jgi:hypothetical protein
MRIGAKIPIFTWNWRTTTTSTSSEQTSSSSSGKFGQEFCQTSLVHKKYACSLESKFLRDTHFNTGYVYNTSALPKVRISQVRIRTLAQHFGSRRALLFSREKNFIPCRRFFRKFCGCASSELRCLARVSRNRQPTRTI